MEKKQKIFIGIGSAASIFLIYFLYQHFRYVETDNAQVEAHWVMLAPKVGGYIKEVLVVEGQKVKVDDDLAKIDDRDYMAILEQAKSNLVSLQARKAEAEKNFFRMVQLYREKAVSQQQYDTANSSYLDFKAKFDSLNSLVTEANLNLEHTKIKAPFDGIVAKKSVEVGQLASPGVPLIGFVGSDERWITANFKETEIEHIHMGAKADVDIDGISRRSYLGKVVAISAATGATFALLPPDNATGNFTKVVQRIPVKILLKNLSVNDIEILRNGLSAVVKVHR